MKKSIWKERVREDASAKGLGSCNRVKRGVYIKKGEGVFIVKGRYHDLAKWLSQYLYFFSFSFHF